MQHILFICGKNKWRSPTAEEIFADHPGVECASAGLAAESEVRVSGELLAWADLIFVMEKTHKTKLMAGFPTYLADKRIICLGIPDKYRLMDTTLIRLLRAKVTPHLPCQAVV
jgi:predicted protein tyrosine phosphatase